MSEEANTFAEFGEEALRNSLQKLTDWADKLIETPGEEPLHKLRVASRRCRAAFSVFDGVFPEPALSNLSREVKGVTDALGAARDLDVMLGWISARMERSTKEQKLGLESYTLRKQSQRIQAQMGVTHSIERLRKSDIHARLDQMTGYVRPVPEVEESLPVQSEQAELVESDKALA